MNAPPPDAHAPSAGDAPIGVFDSGVGGLTVVSALRKLLPSEDIFYLGDTARVPYGGKSPLAVERYSIENSGALLAEKVKMIVVACNTASAIAVPRLRELFHTPVLGVIEPGAATAARTTKNRKIGVIGTRATINSQAYEHAIRKLDPGIHVTARACPVFVPLVEEDWLDDPITDLVVARYLTPMIAIGIDTLVLGCTHYPLLRGAIERFIGPGIDVVDSARACADAVRELLHRDGIAAPAGRHGKLRVALTDVGERFLKVAVNALGLTLDAVEHRPLQQIVLAEDQG